MKKVISVFIMCTSLFAAQLSVEKGSVTISINGSKKHIANNTTIHIPPATSIELLEGDGTVTITAGKSKKIVLQKDSNTSVRVPVEEGTSRDGFWKKMKSYITLALITPNENRSAGEGTKGAQDFSVVNFDIHANPDVEYYILHSEQLFPVPATMTLYATDDTEVATFTFTKDQLAKDSMEVFFSIPTALFQEGQYYKIVCGQRNPKEKMRGEISVQAKEE